jgi:predicted DNA-binding transcriptional regulator YafY
MRAARLIALLRLLQQRQPITAGEIARELELSERTVYRDLSALVDAGVPVYGERGLGGGYRLVEGYRAHLAGLAGPEAQALLSVGAPGLARQLGLSGLLADARRKILTAMTERTGLVARRPRFHLDLSGWGQENREPPPCLPALAGAVMNSFRVTFMYTSRRSTERSWVCEPFGLVLKSGAWFMAARPAGDHHPLNFRVSRMSAVSVSQERFEIPETFDLAAFWESLARAYEATFPSLLVTIQLPAGSHWRVRGQQIGNARPAADDRVDVDLNLEGVEDAVSYLLALGGEAEVLAPESVRSAIAAEASRLSSLYSSDRASGPPDTGAHPDVDRPRDAANWTSRTSSAIATGRSVSTSSTGQGPAIGSAVSPVQRPPSSSRSVSK